jgi:hypothetical protein
MNNGLGGSTGMALDNALTRICVPQSINMTISDNDTTIDTTFVLKRLSDTEEIPIAIRNAGEFLGEMVLVDDPPRSASVTSVAAIDKLEIDDTTFKQALHTNPDLALTLLHNSLASLRNCLQRESGELK